MIKGGRFLKKSVVLRRWVVLWTGLVIMKLAPCKADERLLFLVIKGNDLGTIYAYLESSGENYIVQIVKCHAVSTQTLLNT